MKYVLICTSTLLLGLSSAAAAQATHAAAASTVSGDRALIANALRAAPASIAAGATVVGHDKRVLRKGSTDWVCMPDMPDVPNDTPMCLDAPWRALIDAWMNKKQPSVTAVGFGYMLQGDMPVSNTDPFATAPTATNQWLPNGAPHVMMLLPDPQLLNGISADPNNGGPFVMWKGTPYAHVMIPTSKRLK
ncbi:hypothetical protein [Gemmatimonas sp.]|uniref:hypothetical protein n=1 Tax=Gemmatimonas sp. TaxID=1962908 RepID=UPI0039834D48